MSAERFEALLLMWPGFGENSARLTAGYGEHEIRDLARWLAQQSAAEPVPSPERSGHPWDVIQMSDVGGEPAEALARLVLSANTNEQAEAAALEILRLAGSASASVSDGERPGWPRATSCQCDDRSAATLAEARAAYKAGAAAPSAGDVERNVEAAVRCCRLAGLSVGSGSRPLPSGVDVGDAEREAGERESALENALAYARVRLRQIRRSDKTPDYHYPGDGPHTANRLGEEAPEGERWSTPHELATVALHGIHAVVPWWSAPAPSDVQEDESHG